MSDKENELDMFSGPTMFSKPAEPVKPQDDMFSGGMFSSTTVPDRETPTATATTAASPEPVRPSYPPDVALATLESGRKMVLHKREKTTANTIEHEHNHFGIDIHGLLAKVRKEKGVNEVTNPAQMPVANCLLAEKYRPKIWTDLIGSEKQHRFMLKWLLAWSHVVFGTNLENLDGKRHDSLGRPSRKILMVHGPPGIGKTTVAHILAKQAGYHVMEINASDERNAGSADSSDGKKPNLMKSRISNAIYSQRVEKDNKPVCVVADEIDGAAENGLIRVLLDLIKSDERALQRYQNSDGTRRAVKGKRGKKDKSTLLQRPIIAVCNDAYAPALRELRQHAEMVHYSKVPTRAVVTRLKNICGGEGIKADTTALTEVANSMDGDLRSCLNLLQFGMSRNSTGKLVTKDTSLNLRALSNRVFKRKQEFNSRQEEMWSILDAAHSFGEYDKLLNSCFQLYLHKSYYDDLVKKPSEFGEWTAFYEVMNNAMWRNQNFQLGQYLAHPIAAAYHLFGSTMNNSTADERSTSDYEFFETQRKTQALVKEFMEDMDVHSRHTIDSETFVLELAPFVVRIVNPRIDSSGSSSSLRPAERRRLEDAARVMKSLKLRFVKDRLDAGTSVLRLEPPYEQVTTFSEEDGQRASVGSKYSTRQAIVELMSDENNTASSKKRKAEEMDDDDTQDPQKLERVAKKKSRKQTDFFGRVIEVLDENVVMEEQKDEEKIWVKYAEGFSMAVRKEVTWKDLWM